MTASGVYRVLGMVMTSLVAVKSNIRPGPDRPGQVNPVGSDSFSEPASSYQAPGLFLVNLHRGGLSSFE